MVWAISSKEDEDLVSTFAEQYGLTYPVLLDPDGAVFEKYSLLDQVEVSPYPQEWVIGKDGTVKYFATSYDHEALVAAIEAEL